MVNVVAMSVYVLDVKIGHHVSQMKNVLKNIMKLIVLAYVEDAQNLAVRISQGDIMENAINYFHAKLVKADIWIDYFTGKPRTEGIEFKSNNWLRRHGLPMRRRGRR